MVGSLQCTSPALGVLALVFAAVWPATAEPVHSLRLPSSVASLADAADIVGERPAARVVDDVIRAIHAVVPGIDDAADARRERVFAWLHTASPGTSQGARVVPSPLPGDCWRAALGLGSASDEETAAGILARREFSLVYYGLMRASPGLRSFLASRPDLVAALAGQHAGVLAAFPRSVDVQGGRVRLPGDAALAPVWESLVGAPAADAGAFLLAVQSRANGRLAFLFDTLWRLDEPRRTFALSGGHDVPHLRVDDLRTVAEVFVNTHREWQTAQRPFWRLRIDPLVVLLNVEVDQDGRLAGPQSRAFWRDVLEGKPLSQEATEPEEDEDPVTAGWLLGRVLAGGDLASQQRLGILAFTQRLMQADEETDAALVGEAGRLFAHVPALMLVLERIGLTDAKTYVAVGKVAVALAERANAPEDEAALTTFQAVVSLIDRAVARHGLERADASRLLVELSGLEALGHAGGPHSLSRWVGGDLVPSLHRGSGSGRGAEDVVLDAMAGVGGRHPDEPFQAFALDGEQYRVDLAGPERERLAATRRRQRSAPLGAALQLVQQAQALGEARSDESTARAIAGLSEALDGVASPAGSRGAGPGPDSRLEAARTAVAQFQRKRDQGAAQQRVAEEAASAGDWAVADALRGIVYAASLGDPRETITLAPDVSRRHRLGTGRVPGAPLSAWILPQQSRDDAHVWFVRGALVGLEVALPELALRNLSATADAPALFVYELARRQLAISAALADPFKVTDSQRDRLMDAIARGRSAVATLCDEGGASSDDMADGLAWAHFRWACLEDRASVDELVTLDRLVVLGGADGPAADLHGVGTARSQAWTPLGLRWTDRAGRLAADGRLTDGLFVSAVVAPTLRVVLELAARDLPTALLPDVLAFFLADLIREAPLSFEADAFGLSLGAAQIPTDRFDAYVAALAAGGPIVPAGPAATGER